MPWAPLATTTLPAAAVPMKLPLAAARTSMPLSPLPRARLPLMSLPMWLPSTVLPVLLPFRNTPS